MTNRYYEPNAEFSASALRAEVATLRAQLEAAQSETERLKAEVKRPTRFIAEELARGWAKRWKAKAKELRRDCDMADTEVWHWKAVANEIQVGADEVRARHDALVKLAKELVEECRPHIDFEKLWAVADKMRAAIETATAGSSAAEGEG